MNMHLWYIAPWRCWNRLKKSFWHRSNGLGDALARWQACLSLMLYVHPTPHVSQETIAGCHLPCPLWILTSVFTRIWELSLCLLPSMWALKRRSRKAVCPYLPTVLAGREASRPPDLIGWHFSLGTNQRSLKERNLHLLPGSGACCHPCNIPQCCWINSITFNAGLGLILSPLGAILKPLPRVQYLSLTATSDDFSNPDNWKLT